MQQWLRNGLTFSACHCHHPSKGKTEFCGMLRKAPRNALNTHTVVPLVLPLDTLPHLSRATPIGRATLRQHPSPKGVQVQHPPHERRQRDAAFTSSDAHSLSVKALFFCVCSIAITRPLSNDNVLSSSKQQKQGCRHDISIGRSQHRAVASFLTYPLRKYDTASNS